MKTICSVPRRGFTLIELLVVITIMTILAGLALPAIGMARRMANRTNTQSLMRKVEGGLTLFKQETGGFPYVHWSTATDPPPGENRDPPGNLLAYRLAHDLSPTERLALKADVDAAGQPFEPGDPGNIKAIDYNPRATVSGSGINPSIEVLHLNRMARQAVRMNIMVGNTDLTRPVKGTPWSEGIVRLLPNPTSRGFAADYLAGELQKKDVVGDDIVDLWQTPLIYICPVAPGVTGYATPTGWFSTGTANIIDPAWFGFGPRSRRSATTSLDSDLRDSAASRYAGSYELWSCGPDLQISSQRRSPLNRDNLASQDYQRELH